ncbi:SubName: Full=Uncharacterized protein {ECO:0000313/EMBL:CCA75763.1} [Serendipita indica DSM 11827]|nr:SubName: Full=Uncharacterized protein {ECO:0000313/EMBL:CCA75763.1} [Serendipita indica DSM 11827]
MPLIVIGVLAELRWEIYFESDLYDPYDRYERREQRQSSSHCPESAPNAPTGNYDKGIVHEQIRLSKRMQEVKLQAPYDWAPLTGMPITIFYPSTICSESPVQRGYSDGCSSPIPPDPPREHDSEYNYYNLEDLLSPVQPRSLNCLVVKDEWLLAHTSQTRDFEWTCITPRSLKARDEKRQAGSFNFNNDARNTDHIFSGAAARFLAIHEGSLIRSPDFDQKSHIDRIIADIWSCDALPAHREILLPRWPLNAEIVQPVLLDIACSPTCQSLSWSKNHSPILMAAHYGSAKDPAAMEILAMAFHTAMRPDTIVDGDTWDTFTKRGLVVQEHTPVYRCREDISRRQKVSPGWGAVSSTIVVQTMDVFYSSSYSSLQSLAILLRIGSRAREILHKLEMWRGYDKVLNV